MMSPDLKNGEIVIVKVAPETLAVIEVESFSSNAKTIQGVVKHRYSYSETSGVASVQGTFEENMEFHLRYYGFDIKK